MEAVSATKMRKSQEFALKARPYAVASLEMLKNILARTNVLPPLLSSRQIKTSLLLVVTSDKGLAGAFNSNLLKLAENWVENKRRADQSFLLVTVGKKAREYFTRRLIPLQEIFQDFGDHSKLQDTLPVAKLILQGFLKEQWDEAEAVYTHFRTTLKQEAVLHRILPATREGIEEIVQATLPEHGRFADFKPLNLETSAEYRYEYKFEPSPEEILNNLPNKKILLHNFRKIKNMEFVRV